MSKKSALILYRGLDYIEENKSYCERYIKFHELYWDGPATSQSIFYGREYEEYKESLSKYLEIEISQIEDCLFTKHENGRYYLVPLGVNSNEYILEHENFILPEWFLLFDDSEKRFLYSHAGDGAVQPAGIFYNTNLANSKKRLQEVQKILESLQDNNISKELKIFMEELSFGISEISIWISNFPEDNILVLNYAELNSVIHQFALKNENSVRDLWEFINLIGANKYDEAYTNLKIYKQKWNEISQKCLSTRQFSDSKKIVPSDLQ